MNTASKFVEPETETSVEANNSSASLESLSPMLREYLEFKSNYPDSYLFFQVGDFYEVFFEDATAVAAHLNITLTSRDKNKENPIPMCGVPLSAIDTYVGRLVKLGFSVAIVSQNGNVAAPGRTTVERVLERFVTPSVQFSSVDEIDEAGALASLIKLEDETFLIAWSHVQNCTIAVSDPLAITELREFVKRHEIAEVVALRVPSASRTVWFRSLADLLGESRIKIRDAESLQSMSRQAERFSSIKGLSELSPSAAEAVKLLVSYVDEVCVSSQVPFRQVELDDSSGQMVLDSMTRENLELLSIRHKERKGAPVDLVSLMDKTESRGGSRLLKRWILSPLLDLKAIADRHDSVEYFLRNSGLASELRTLMKNMPDLERLALRTELGMLCPREIAALREAFSIGDQCCLALDRAGEFPLGDIFEATTREQLAEMRALFEAQFEDQIPTNLGTGKLFRKGLYEDLDACRELKESGKNWLASLESQEREKTGVGSLKIKYNGVLGYFFEVPKSQRSKVPSYFIERQQLVNAVRFVTEELKAKEKDIQSADSRLLTLEETYFDELRKSLAPRASFFRKVSESLSTIDVLLAFALCAESFSFIRPSIFPEGKTVRLEGSRHPLVEYIGRGEFVPNDLFMNTPEIPEHFFVLTGPNMGGKSTYLRQVAVSVILGQAGSFVPASKAEFSLVDRVFARLGAHDDLVEGQSTFMIEMMEASHILSRASERSLVLIDEIGRGTSVEEGVALARAIAEWVIERLGCRTIFATHFYELTELEKHHGFVKNLSVGSVERDGKVYFTHQVEEGPAKRSYGLEVARLANLPDELLEAAKRYAEEFIENAFQQGKRRPQQISLLDREQRSGTAQEGISLLREISRLEINNLTPLEALQELADLVKSAEDILTKQK